MRRAKKEGDSGEASRSFEVERGDVSAVLRLDVTARIEHARPGSSQMGAERQEAGSGGRALLLQTSSLRQSFAASLTFQAECQLRVLQQSEVAEVLLPIDDHPVPVG